MKPTLEERMFAEIEAVRKRICPEIPHCAIDFKTLMERMGSNASENQVRKWLSAEMRSGRWKKARTVGGKARTVYWKAE